MPTPKEDKRSGRLLPTPVTPPTQICFKIVIPNAVPYRAALFGVLNQLGVWSAWDHPLDGTECIDCEEAAQLWRDAIAASYFSEECEVDPMSCDDIADCIETSPNVRNAIGAIIAPRSPLAEYTYPPGEPLPTSAMTEPLNPIDDCNFNAFWAQVDQYIEYMVSLGQDTLEQLEFYSNALEAGENVPMGALVGKLKSGTTTGKVMEFLNWLGEVMKEAYEASNTEANRTALKCDMFCAFRDACSITIQGTLDVINERVGGLFTPAALNSLPELAEMMTTVALNPAIALDMWIGFLMGTAKTAALFGVQGIDETLNLMLAVAVNDANNDWELLCEDCDTPPPDPNCIDFTTETGTWAGESGTTWIDGEGFKPTYDANFNETSSRILRAASSGVIEKVVVTYSVPQTSVFIQNGDGSGYRLRTVPASTTIEFSAATMGAQWANRNAALGIRIGATLTGNTTAASRIVQACVYFAP